MWPAENYSFRQPLVLVLREPFPSADFLEYFGQRKYGPFRAKRNKSKPNRKNKPNNNNKKPLGSTGTLNE